MTLKKILSTVAVVVLSGAALTLAGCVEDVYVPHHPPSSLPPPPPPPPGG
jgi:hypothetical protein